MLLSYIWVSYKVRTFRRCTRIFRSKYLSIKRPYIYTYRKVPYIYTCKVLHAHTQGVTRAHIQAYRIHTFRCHKRTHAGVKNLQTVLNLYTRIKICIRCSMR